MMIPKHLLFTKAKQAKIQLEYLQTCWIIQGMCYCCCSSSPPSSSYIYIYIYIYNYYYYYYYYVVVVVAVVIVVVVVVAAAVINYYLNYCSKGFTVLSKHKSTSKKKAGRTSSTKHFIDDNDRDDTISETIHLRYTIDLVN